jgi:hypothetical protein
LRFEQANAVSFYDQVSRNGFTQAKDLLLERLSIFQATQAGLIRKGTAYELLEAQASCGKIVDVQTGRVLSVETASKTGVFDAEYE